MSTLKSFDGHQTKWVGLWWHPEYCGFSSPPFNLAALKGFKGTVKLFVRKNKFYNGGENGRPNYTFCIKDSDSTTFTEIEVEEEPEQERTFTYEEVQRIINLCACEIGGDAEYGEHLVEDYIGR